MPQIDDRLELPAHRNNGDRIRAYQCRIERLCFPARRNVLAQDFLECRRLIYRGIESWKRRELDCVDVPDIEPSARIDETAEEGQRGSSACLYVTIRCHLENGKGPSAAPKRALERSSEICERW